MRKAAVVVAFLATSFFVPAYAFAADPLADVDPDDLGDLEEQTFGTRGLLRTRAESVSFDGKEKSVDLNGNVRIDSPPFHLRSGHLHISRTRYGVEAEGEGRLAFCPCLGTPLTIEFDKAIVAPPGELLLRHPKLEIYGVPVMYLPWFWMRSDEKVGVLPPEIAYRGQDGVFFGGGVHLPYKDRGAREAFDLRGGGYLEGGFIADVRHRSPHGATKVRYDRLRDDGLTVDARGARDGVVWDADVIRGRRGIVATTDVDAAARPWDRASATGSVRLGPVITETGVRVVSRRGGDLTALDAWGPFLALRSSGAATNFLTYDTTIEGGSLRAGTTSVSYARAEVGARASGSSGIFAFDLSARGAGNVAAESNRDGSDRAGAARFRMGIPLLRAFGSSDTADPLLHRIEPFASAGLLHAKGDAILGTLPGRGLAALSGTSPITDAGFTTTLGRWGERTAIELLAAGGSAYGSSVTESGVRPLARYRLAASTRYFGASVDGGHLFGEERVRGDAMTARARIGREDSLRFLANVATRDGLDPVLARALTDAPLEPPAGFLVRPGTTGGAGLVIPWARALTTSTGVDFDATNREIVALRGGVEVRDRCGCVTLRGNGSHRIGRDGVDVWVALDFATDR